MISRSDISILNRARRTLRSIANRSDEDGAFSEGKLDEACEGAERSLANVLTVAKFYNGVEISDDDLYLNGGSE